MADVRRRLDDAAQQARRQRRHAFRQQDGPRVVFVAGRGGAFRAVDAAHNRRQRERQRHRQLCQRVRRSTSRRQSPAAVERDHRARLPRLRAGRLRRRGHQRPLDRPPQANDRSDRPARRPSPPPRRRGTWNGSSTVRHQRDQDHRQCRQADQRHLGDAVEQQRQESDKDQGDGGQRSRATPLAAQNAERRCPAARGRS